ncbi:MAG: MBL fold metallo-hydrolase [Lachnospiraceae bacterium]|jgi:hypothetical protein|nr:MBL fold metallo-hydrolase [Lachnospiraceae bacterium]MCI8960938.1 MBL fold metallo-hydrolase [Lachnospiraceae bacterium]
MSADMKIRSFNVGCNHEIILPNGKTILVDPYFPETLPQDCQKECICGADYILLTHSHFDHDAEVEYFVKKYNAKVFCGFMSAMAVLEYHHVPFDNMIPVFPGHTYHMDGFTVEVSQAKHNEMQGKTYDPDMDLAPILGGRPGHHQCDVLGSIESTDYRIVTDTGFSIAFVSGIHLWEDRIIECQEQKSNVVIRQATMREGGKQVSPEKLAQLFTQYKSQIVVPFHNENVERRLVGITIQEYFSQVDTYIQKLAPGCQVKYLETGKWYSMGCTVHMV